MSEDRKKFRETIADIFIPKGKECGEKIAEVLRKRGYETVIPLYRSAVVIEVEKDGDGIPYILVKSFDDPHWIGAEEIDDETVGSGYGYMITGSRSGIDFYDVFQEEMDEKGEMYSKSVFESMSGLDKERGFEK